ncbi:hypothetical protein TUM12370_24540 [Salmonella enterica subsp. enterica serovar Choleraesuis]|nr:hypothetical protein TUM12370_24540 [Salmonella enterica subsp. enterica serovar Choleraesuis]
MTKSELFKAAWTMSRNAAAKFGGSVKSFFAEALRIMHNTAESVIEKLEKLGGNRWQKNEMDRIYFNFDTIAEVCGFEFGTYKTGNVSWASLRGDKIANGRATGIRASMGGCKLWFDVKAERFFIRDYNNRDLPADAILEAFAAVIAK